MLPLLFQLRLSLCGMFLTHTLSLSLKVLHHSNTRVLERHASSNHFLSLWRISNIWTPAVRNLIIMHCSTLTDTFCSLISLAELRPDRSSSQLPEREGREETPLVQSQYRDRWGFTLAKIQSRSYLRTQSRTICQYSKSEIPKPYSILNVQGYCLLIGSMLLTYAHHLALTSLRRDFCHVR